MYSGRYLPRWSSITLATSHPTWLTDFPRQHRLTRGSPVTFSMADSSFSRRPAPPSETLDSARAERGAEGDMRGGFVVLAAALMLTGCIKFGNDTQQASQGSGGDTADLTTLSGVGK